MILKFVKLFMLPIVRGISFQINFNSKKRDSLLANRDFLQRDKYKLLDRLK